MRFNDSIEVPRIEIVSECGTVVAFIENAYFEFYPYFNFLFKNSQF